MSRAFVADRGDAHLRLDQAIVRRLADVPRMSRTRVQRWIDQRLVLVNGRPARRASAPVAAGDRIEVRAPETRERRAVPAAETSPLDVLYEDDHILALNKPAGIVVHPTYKNLSGTLLNAVLGHVRRGEAASPVTPRFLSRLDKYTSGVLLVSKTSAAHARLQRDMAARAPGFRRQAPGRAFGSDFPGARSQKPEADHRLFGGPSVVVGAGFSRPSVLKEYLAIVHGRPRRGRGVIAFPLGTDPNDRRRVIACDDGRPSETRYEVVARGGGMSVVRCDLVTGRTHQIRVHLASSGWPIVGDALYGKAGDTFARQALHAWRVSFAHPQSGELLEVTAPLPRDLAELLEARGLRPRGPGLSQAEVILTAPVREFRWDAV